MKITAGFVYLFVLLSLNTCTPWSKKLAGTIRGKEIDTIFGQTQLQNSPLNPFSNDPNNLNEEYQGGGLYRFEVLVSNDTCAGIVGARVLVETTQIRAPIITGRCYKLRGAYNNEGKFIALTIYDISYEPNLLICDW